MVSNNILWYKYHSIGTSSIFKFHCWIYLFHDGVPSHIKTSLLICGAEQINGVISRGAFDMKESNLN